MPRYNTPIVLTPQDEARFWAKVDRSGGPDACWPWTGARDGYGYGYFAVRGKPLRAHRVAWTIANGPIPDGMIICHRCDNPPCCNPACHFAGTDADNSADMVAKNRQRGATGDRNPSRLYPERFPRGDNHPMRLRPELARRGDLHPRRIDPERWPSGEDSHNAKLDNSTVAEIRRRFAAGGITRAALAREYGMSKSSIGRIISGQTWRSA